MRFEGNTLWLSQKEMAELYQVTKQNISYHIRTIFKENELVEGAVVKQYLTTAEDGKRYRTALYNLDAILAVGYRVRSNVGTRFRQWATERLHEYLIKGFVLDDVRLKEGVPQGIDYFDELLARIRDIRSSEKVFYRKLRDIFKDLSADYPIHGQDELRRFFQKIQNKVHWAAAGATAAEIVATRADADKPDMGLTNWSGTRIRKLDVCVAKNYLTEPELETLNRVVTMFLEQAEFRASRRQLIHMSDWETWLDEFLRFSELPVLDHAGRIRAQDAQRHAELEYSRYDAKRRTLEDAAKDQEAEQAWESGAALDIAAREIEHHAKKR